MGRSMKGGVAIGAMLVVALAASALASPSAWATGRPAFLGPSGELTETQHPRSYSLSLMFSQIDRVVLVCLHTIEKGTILPNSTTTRVVRINCRARRRNGKEGEFPNCKVKSTGAPEWGLTEEARKGLLVFIGSKAQAEKEEGAVGLDFTPTSGSSFETIEFEGECPEGVSGETAVTGSVIAEVSPVARMMVAGTVAFPETAIAKGYWDEGGVLTEEKASLKAFGGEKVTDVETAEEELESKEEWGVIL